jgi:flagellar basal-body rod protein FlgB
MPAFAGVDTTRLLVTGMKVAQDNVRITANNIANVDTPGYNPVHLDFQATLRDAIEGRGTVALRRTRPQHLDASRQHLGTGVLVRTSKNDYNKVDIEEEIANLSEYRGKYVLYSSLLTKQFSMVKSMLSQAR